MSLVGQVKFGTTGIKISPIIVGCMSYGSKLWAPWVLDDEEEVFEILKYCYDAGIRTFDTADVYSNGVSERLLGKFLQKYKIKRETVVILSKINFPVDESLGLSMNDVYHHNEATALDLANQRGLSRKHIISGAAQSVERLGTYIDVLQIHRFDPDTPIEETMRALNDVVESGLTRYIGASTMLATEFVEMQHVAETHGWFKFVSWQTQYNLLYREDEREIMPYSKKRGIALIPWSPNRRGFLTRPLGQQTERSKRDILRFNLSEADKEIIGRVEELSKRKGVSMAAISTAWVLSKGCNPIVGMSTIERVKDALSALSVELSEDETKYLEEAYLPKHLE
ncbi:BN860_19350g1_1 [Zygosaccharomyces bailii CLIB 213]|uniref:BN860_19350g1_1 n=1 Tax=Zygosaccharomyces bailii (strain CLIB 213 / ATCC 58445 / CBS 680 / BCRC 21525 / NBRC 1098 / NCYC 1416 / NRRL Y-2227) TaxID=1333698 RepID=A0A8J2T424_ZYGB2|nr:BN860_19350g1_1 [Zygosaccharomyces bailii CLIB 213]